MKGELDEHSLKRDVGWYGSFSMGYADVGADIYVAIGLVAFYAGGASPLAFAVASITYVCTGLAYAELATTYPYAGGAQVYAMKAFNDLTGFLAGWALMLDYTVDIALFSLATAGYLSFFAPWLKATTLSLSILGNSVSVSYLGIIAFVIVLFLLALNSIGIRQSSLFNETLVSASLVVMAAILVAGLALAFSPARFLSQITTLGAASKFQNIAYIFPSLGIETQNFIYGITIAMTSFIGIESIAQAAEETKRPHKWIPRANKLSIISVVVFALGLSAASIGIMPWQNLAADQSDPMTAIATSIPTIGSYLAPVVALIGLAICYVSTNTGVIGVSRVAFSMGRFDLLPRWFYRVHARFRTPIRTIIMFGLIGALLALGGELHFVAGLYNFGALISYVIVNLSLIVLRNTEPEAFRAWKVPGTLRLGFGNRKLFVPVISVVGAIATSAMWILIVGFHADARILGAAWVTAGILGFAAFRRSRGLPVVQTETGKKIPPGGYVMNAVVLVRTPEDEAAIVRSIRESLDPRFRITLFSILDPSELGLAVEHIKDYGIIKTLQEKSEDELRHIARKLRSEGFDAQTLVEVGPLAESVRAAAESPDNDVVVLIKRKTLKGHLEKREESAYAIASEYPGKLMVVRRTE